MKWKDIGLALGLRYSVLEIIEATHDRKARLCLEGVVVQYVRKSYNCNRFGNPSWQGLVKAVALSAGGDDLKLAQAIMKEHPAKGTLYYFK